MHFWRKRYFETLRDIAREAGATPEWSRYAAYCLECERGFRQRAFAILDQFISSMERAEFGERRRFVSWLLTRAEGRDGREVLLPHPLRLRVVEPTLLEWTIVEPECSEPHRWLGRYEDVERAVELDTSDQLARRKLVVSLLGQVGYATHELPIGYLGVASEDMAKLDRIESLLARLQSEGDRSALLLEVEEQRALIGNYLRGK